MECALNLLLQLQVTVKRAAKTVDQVQRFLSIPEGPTHVLRMHKYTIVTEMFGVTLSAIQKRDAGGETKGVIRSARANATHNHGLDGDLLLVAEAFVGKGFFKKRISYHSKGRSGIKMRPECRLTVVVREITPEEEAEIARLRVNNFRKLTKREKRLVPHKLIETTPTWARKSKTRSQESGAMGA
ncbi:unnamed protein product [Fraxinus pennsylvanica]|uniref:50S ribosomal protein L22, chloroplastic n=1 Tax=Fraxinus pennsylvanica TaxID=56036 RepID=A0AAD2A8B0_9LAMI|nr:unnamed protein product [Fraxinus pennsylvanica]